MAISPDESRSKDCERMRNKKREMSAEQLEKERQRLHESYLRHKEERMKRRDEHRKANLELYAGKQRDYRERNKEKVCERARKWYQENKERKLADLKIKRDTVRSEMITSYGGKCSCCGEDNPRFLTLDHIDGGGRLHREILNAGGTGIMYHLKNMGWPQEGYQLLCYNCNCGRAHNSGICPHNDPRYVK